LQQPHVFEAVVVNACGTAMSTLALDGPRETAHQSFRLQSGMRTLDQPRDASEP